MGNICHCPGAKSSSSNMYGDDNSIGKSKRPQSRGVPFFHSKNTIGIVNTTIVQPMRVDTLVRKLSREIAQNNGDNTATNGIVINGRTVSNANGNSNNNNQTTTTITTEQLSMRDRELIAKCWRTHIMTSRRDIFHKTMLQCIEASPKMNEVIACQRYCYRDLTKWPKLNKMCKAQFYFYEKLIYELNMDEKRMHEACARLGQVHASYAQYGLKPHFLDIYHQQFIGLITKLPFENADEREQTVQAFSRLIAFIVDVMMQAYSQRMCENRGEEIVRKNSTIMTTTTTN